MSLNPEQTHRKKQNAAFTIPEDNEILRPLADNRDSQNFARSCDLLYSLRSNHPPPFFPAEAG